MLQQSYIFSLSVALLLLFSTAFAQESTQSCNFELRGKVIDKHNHENLPYATVFVKEANKWATTDSLGNYTIKNLCPGKYTVFCSHISCKELKAVIAISENTTYNFKPEHHAIELRETEIHSTRLDASESNIKSDINEAELEQFKGKSIGELLSNINGVNTLKSGPNVTKTVIHGLHSNRILTLNNGVRQEDQQWGTEHAAQIDGFSASNVSVIKGAESVRYGSDAIGGVVLIETGRLPYGKTNKGDIYIIGNSNGLQGITAFAMEGSLLKEKNFAYSIKSSISKAGDFNAPKYNLTNTGLHQSNIVTSLGYKKERLLFESHYSHFQNTSGILKSAHIGNLTDLQTAFKSPTPLYIEDFTYYISNPKQESTHQLWKTNGHYIFPNLGKLELQYAWQQNNRKEYDIRKLDFVNTPSLDITLQTQTADLVLVHNPISNMNGSIGFNGIYQINRNSFETGISPLIPNYLSSTFGGFILEKYKMGKNEIEAGIRFDSKYLYVAHYQEKNIKIEERTFENFAASLGYIHHFEDGSLFKTNIGSAYRAPNMSELYSNGLHHSAASIELGNPNLVSEKSAKWVSSFESQVNEKVSIEVSAFFNYIENYIYLEPQKDYALTIRGAFPVFEYKQTNANFVGSDASIHYQINKYFDWKSQISFLNATDITNKTFLIQIPSNRLSNSISFKIDSLKNNKNLFLTLSERTVFHQNRTPTTELKTAPDTYHVFDIYSGITILLKNNKLNLGFAIENLFNTSYRDYMNRFRFFSDELGRNFQIKLKYEI